MSTHVESGVSVNTAERGLKKHNLKVSTVVFMIFSLVAAGCYGIESMIPEAGPGLTLIMLMVIPFVWALPFGFVAAELGSARPQEGGYYKWVQEALGEFWGFQAGWWRTISIYIDNTLYVILAGSYLAGQFNLDRTAELITKVLMILIFTYVNIRGVKDVGIVTNILAIFVLAAFTMIAIVGFINWNQNPFMPLTPEPAESLTDWFFYIGGGLAVGLWMYCGYESMSTIAGEVEDPQVIPRATIISLPLIICSYVLPTMASLASFGRWPEWGEEAGTLGYADVAAHYLGYGAGVFFAIVAVLAQCLIYNTYIASGSRGFFALADDNLAPPILVRVDKKHGVPYVAVLSVAIVNLILCNFAFSTVVVVDLFMLVSSYVMIFLSAMILRKRIPASDYKFKIPGGYGFLCLLCIMPIFVAFFFFFLNGADYFIGGMIGIVSGPVLYFIWRRMYGGLSKKDPAVHPKNPRTGLAVGDTKRISVIFLILTFMGAIGSVFLPWYEGEWGPEYYLETYGSGPLADFGGMIFAIRAATIASAVLTVVFYLMSKSIEPKPAEPELPSEMER